MNNDNGNVHLSSEELEDLLGSRDWICIASPYHPCGSVCVCVCVCVWGGGGGGGGGVISQMSDTTEPPILTVLILPDSLQIQFNSLLPKECTYSTCRAT